MERRNDVHRSSSVDFLALPVTTNAATAATPSRKSSSGPVRGIIAGALTGAVEMCVNFPTDYVKTQLQLDEQSVQRRYTGPIDVIKQTVRTHGIRGLYRGLNIAIWNPKVAVRFGAFEQLKKMASGDNGKLTHSALFLCGMGAGVVESVLSSTPFESIKVKFIHDQNSAVPRYKGLFGGIRQIILDKGIRGLYQGVIPTIIKSSSSQGTRFFAVETLKDWRKEKTGSSIVSKPLTAVFGALGGAVSVYLNAPADIVKSRMQGLDAAKYRGTWDCLYQIWTKEGPTALYRGVAPRLVKVPMEAAIVFTVYDFISELMNTI